MIWNLETKHFGLQKGTNLFHKSYSLAPCSNFPFPWEGMLLCSLCGSWCNFNSSLSNTLLFNIKNSVCLMEQCSMES